MTTISKKQNFLAASAIAAMTSFALSISNAVSAANLTTYDFEYSFGNLASGIGHITVDKNDPSFSSGVTTKSYTIPKWLDFNLVYSQYGRTYNFTKSDLSFGVLYAYNYSKGVVPNYYEYDTYGDFRNYFEFTLKNGYQANGQDSATNFDTFLVDRQLGLFTRAFSLTERQVLPVPAKPVPVPAFALGIVAAGGWIASKQLRRQTKAVKKEVAV